MDSGTDSVTSTPRSTQKTFNVGDDLQGVGNGGGGGRVRFMCSFGGRILPRPHDNQLRYVGGDTRIVAVSRNTTYAALLAKLSKLCPVEDVTVKYQLPHEELDALITVASDEDVENMMEEWERFAHQQQQQLLQQQQTTNNSPQNNNNNPNNNNKPSRLRLFLFANNNYKNGADNTNTNAISILDSEDSRGSDLASLLDGSTKRENWFLDALNGGGKAAGSSGGLERGRSEASSIAAEVPDCLFGLDNLEDTQIQTTTQTQQQQLLPSRLRNARDILSDHIPASDPSSPSPAGNSPFGSTSSAPAAACVPSMMPNVKLPPVKTKPDNNNNNNNNSMDGSVDLVGEPGSGSSAGFQQQPNSAGYGAGQAVWAQQQQLQQQQQQHHPFQPATSHFPGQPALQPMPIYYVAAPPPGAAQVRAMPVPGQYVQQQYHQQISQQQQGGQVPMGYHQAMAAGPGGQIYRQVAVSAGDPYQEMQARMVAAGGNQQTVYYGVRGGAGPVPAYHQLQGGGEEMVGFGNSDPSGGRG